MHTTSICLSLFAFGVLGVASCVSSERVGETKADISSGPDLIECRDDTACPRGSYCEPGLALCFTGSRCIVDNLPSDAYCKRLYGDAFICYEYGPDSWHCMPTE